MPARQFNIFDKVLRLIPRAFSASVTVKPNGSTQYRVLLKLHQDAGDCALTLHFLLMIIFWLYKTNFPIIAPLHYMIGQIRQIHPCSSRHRKSFARLFFFIYTPQPETGQSLIPPSPFCCSRPLFAAPLFAAQIVDHFALTIYPCSLCMI